MRSKLNKYITAVHNSRLNAASCSPLQLQWLITISPAHAEKLKSPDESSGPIPEIGCGARDFKGEKGIII
jgi:hypothetical protein